MIQCLLGLGQVADAPGHGKMSFLRLVDLVVEVGWLAGWLVGWLVGCLVGCLVGQLVLVPASRTAKWTMDQGFARVG